MCTVSLRSIGIFYPQRIYILDQLFTTSFEIMSRFYIMSLFIGPLLKTKKYI